MAGVVGPSLSITEADLGSREKWSRLGSGNFSTVYKAFCNRHNGFVAVKEIHRGSLHEVKKLVKALSHDHIINIKAVLEDRNLIIMEYCRYSLRDLRDGLGDSLIPWPQCINFMQQIMSGLEYLHSLRIVHRDLKPANILVTEDFVCKIGDLGLAKEEGSYSNSSSGGDIKCPSGTLVFICPERWDNPGQRAVETDDIYSCGILMFKMITNENIFGAEKRGHNDATIADLKLWVAHKKRRPNIENIHQGGDPAPPIVEEVILACWDPEIEKRRTSQHWADHLREYIKNNIRKQELENAKQQLKKLLGQNARFGPTLIDPSRTGAESLDPQAGGEGASEETGRNFTGSDVVDSHPNSEPLPLHTEVIDEEPIVPSGFEPQSQQPPPRGGDGAGDGAVTKKDNDPGDNGGRQGNVPLQHLSSREDLEGSMSNLCVDGEIDVTILDDSDGVAQHYHLELTSYKLSFHHGMKQLVFYHDRNEPVHIPHSLVHSYRLGPEGDNTVLLYFPSGKPLTLSVPIEQAVSGLQALGVPASPEHEEVSPVRPLKTNEISQQQTNSAAHQKNTGRHNVSGHGTPGKQPPQHQWTPPESNQRAMSAHPNSMGPQSQPISVVTIHHVDTYNHYTAPVQAPSTTHRPPYGRSRLTESATMVSRSDMIKVQTDVSTKYERMGMLLGIEEVDIQSIKVQNSGDLEAASYKLMKAWVSENGSGASKAQLARALYDSWLYEAAIRIS